MKFYQNKTPRPPQSGTELRGPWSLCGRNGGWRSAYLSSALWSAPPTVKLAVEPLWLRVKGVSPAPRAATSEREREEVQRFDVLAVLYELHEAQLVVFIHEVDDLVQQLFAVAASDGIAGVGAGAGQRY